jgi:hypothetical protein
MMMTLEQAVLEGLKALPIEKQQEVLDFVDFLCDRQKKGEIALEQAATLHQPLRGTVLYYEEPFAAAVSPED